MTARSIILLALMCAVLLATVASAAAAPPTSSAPEPGAQLVRRDVATGAQAVQAGLSSVDSVRVGQRETVINVNDDAGPHAITVDYSELSKDKKTAGLGLLAIGYVGMGTLARLLRLLRSAGLMG